MMLVSGLLLLSLLAQFGPPHVTGPAHTVAPPPWTFALMLVQGAGHLWTGRLLSRRLRIGGQMALATLGLPVLDAIPYLLRGSPGGLYALLMSALGCALVLSVWRELD
jgi:hypothetical protein